MIAFPPQPEPGDGPLPDWERSDLAQLVANYARCNFLAQSSIWQHRVALRKFEAFLQRDGSPADLNRDSIIDFCRWYGEQVAPPTVYAKQRCLLAWWQFADEEGLTSESPRKVKRVRLPEKVPQAWNERELQAILNACDRLGPSPYDRTGGCFLTGVPRGKFFRAFTLSFLDTGLRLTAGLHVRRSDVRADLTFTARWQYQKTWVEADKRFSPRTWSEICALGDHEFCLPYGQTVGQRVQLWKWWKRILRMAGLDDSKGTGPQQLRRTAASFKELQERGSAKRFLVHKTAGLAEKSYISPRIVAPQIVAGPTLNLS